MIWTTKFQIQRLQKKILLRKLWLQDRIFGYYNFKYNLTPDWNFMSEVANDPVIKKLSEKIDKLLIKTPKYQCFLDLFR